MKIRKSENRKIKNVNNLRYENFEIFRFLKKSWSKFLTSRKYFFDRNFLMKIHKKNTNRLRIWFWISNVPSRNAEEAGGRLQRPPGGRQPPWKKNITKSIIKKKQNYILYKVNQQIFVPKQKIMEIARLMFLFVWY